MIFLDLPERTIWYLLYVRQHALCHLCDIIPPPTRVAKYYNLSPLPSTTRITTNRQLHQTLSPPLSSEGHHLLYFHLSGTPPQYHNHGTARSFRRANPSSRASNRRHNSNDHCHRNLRSPPTCHFCYIRSGYFSKGSKGLSLTHKTVC